MRHAVIMAGGSGTRLWPLSRRSRPKQLLRLFDGESLLRKSFERLAGVLPAGQIYVITGHDYLPAVAADLPELPAENLIGEPCPRDTANAVGLAAHLLALKDPGGTMGVFTADHIITPVETFRETLLTAYQAAETHADALITFGIPPASPHTGYGYVHRGLQLAPHIHEVLQFREKPDLATAKEYLASGEYYWNSGMFVWRIDAILEQFRKHQPQMADVLHQVAGEFSDDAARSRVAERFGALPKISVDFAIMEKADRVLAVELPCQWLDVGSWTSLSEVLPLDRAGNIRAAPHVAALDATDNIFVSESDHLIAAIGVRDLVVVHSDDATLICRREDAQRIKDLFEALKRTHGEQYA
jgi:mannose-1-phosphate guanylyltransferase